MKKTLLLVLFAAGMTIGLPQAHANYFQNLGKAYVRGLKNVVGAPAEIPIGIQNYHEQTGLPVLRHTAGLLDGTLNGIRRAGSGVWDFIQGIIPSDQTGLPLNPDTLF